MIPAQAMGHVRAWSPDHAHCLWYGHETVPQQGPHGLMTFHDPSAGNGACSAVVSCPRPACGTVMRPCHNRDLLEASRAFRADNSVEMEFDFAIDHAAQALDEALRFVVGLSNPDDGVQRRAM